MFRSLFGKRKKRRPSDPKSTRDETIRSVGVGDVVVISGFSPTLEDAYVITEKVNRYESPFGKWYDLVGSDEDRRMTIEWSDDDGLSIFVSMQEAPMGLSGIGLTEDELGRMDQEQSIDSYIDYEDERYFYSNSYEVFRFENGGDEGEGFYLWEFFSKERQRRYRWSSGKGCLLRCTPPRRCRRDLVSVYNK